MKRFFSTIFILFMLCTLSRAQLSRIYTTEDGLTSSNILNMTLDSKGRLWISEMATVDIFTGTSFCDLFGTITKDAPLLNSVRGVAEDEDDTFWISTSNGLYNYDCKDNSMDRVFLSAEEDSVKGYPILSVTDYPRMKRKLVATEGMGLFVINSKTHEVDSVMTDTLNHTIGNVFSTSATVDADGNLWIGIFGGHAVMRVDLKAMKTEMVRATPEAAFMMAANGSAKIVQLGASRDIMVLTSGGVLLYDRKLRMLRTLKTPAPRMPFTAALETRNGEVLLGTDSYGIFEYNRDDESLTPYFIDNASMNISYGKVRAMAEDSEGTLIVALAQKGILVRPEHTNNFQYHAIAPTVNRPNATSITYLTADSLGNMWIGTDGCGVFRSEGRNLSKVRQVSDGLRSSLVQCIAIDGDNRVWVGSYGGGVQCLVDGKFVTPGWLGMLTDAFVKSIIYSRAKNCLYIGTNGQGVFMADLAKHTLQPMFAIDEVNWWVSNMYLDSNGTLWIGTAQGTFIYNTIVEKLNKVTYENSEVLMVNCFEESDEAMLIGTSSGLVAYNRKTRKWEVLLPGERIMSVVNTDADVWVSTAKHIYLIDRSMHKAHRYTSFGGYYIGEFHQNSQYQSERSEIYFGCDNGIISFNVASMKRQKPISGSIMFTSLQVNGEPAYYNDDITQVQMNSNIFSMTELKLRYDHNSFTVRFAVPNYSAPNRIVYCYMLENYENTWHQCSQKPEAYYASLPSGDYTLKVRAYFETDESTVLERELSIHIGRPWYSTTWAWLVYILITCSLLYYMYRFYIIRQRQQRLLIMARQNDHLKETKLKMFTSVAHELRSPLTMILSPLRQLMSITDDEHLLCLYDVMKSNCDRLVHIVRQLTDMRKIDSGQFKLHFSEVDFDEYSARIFQSFTAHASIKHISMTVEHADPHTKIWLDETHFEKIMTNLLSNAMKFTPAEGHVLVRTRCVQKQLRKFFEIRVYNSGSHIDENDIPHIFECFYQGKTSEAAQGSGIGLNLVKELVELHHGRIEPHNIEPDGVEFVMLFPLGKGHLSDEELVPIEKHSDSECDDSDVIDMFDGAITIEPLDDEDEGMAKHKRTLLIVDDDQSLCQYIKEQMNDDYNVLTANSGNSAWQLILTQRPDCVVTDIRMDDGDGVELCKRIKDNPETDNTPIIMLTSETSDRVRIQSLNLQVDHFISKPFNLILLKGAIAQCIRVREKLMGRLRRTEVGYDYSATTMDNPEDKLFARISEAIKKNLDDSTFGVNELATTVGISRVHLNRKMKERYGISPNNFLRSYRLKQAAYLLVNNNVNISEVAYKVGFSSHSHFSNTFHDYFGMTPREFILYYSENVNDELFRKLLE